MSARIFNRDFEHPSSDGWYMIEPRGEHPNSASKVVQCIDSEAARSIVSRFNSDATAGKLSHGKEMLIDREHWKHDLDKDTTAYGWLQQLDDQPDGIYGKIRWTGTGGQAVDNGDYRFFSTEYAPDDLEVLDGGSPRRVRPLRLDGLTLTNQPNNKGGKPITNRASDNAVESEHPDLDAWFAKVSAVRNSAAKMAHTSMTFHQAWDIAKQVHPEAHAAAFAPVLSAAQGDLAKAAPAITEIANRVDAAMGYSPRAARLFVREKLPEVFTALRASVGNDVAHLLNGRVDSLSPAASAARTFNRLVEEEKKQYGISTSHAFARVCNREPVLTSLAKGETTAEEAFRSEPTLKNRLT